MDWWERNKDFAIRVGAGVAIFLVALIVRGCVADDPREATRRIGGAKSVIRNTPVPPRDGLRRLADRIESVRERQVAIAEQIGHVLRPDGLDEQGLQRNLIRSVLTRIGRSDPREFDEYMRLGESARFSRLYDEVRRHYARVAIEQGMAIDEGLGFEEARVEQADILRAFHLLDVVTRVVEDAKEAGVSGIERIVLRLSRERGASESEAFIERDAVLVSLKARDEALIAFQNALSAPGRFLPIQSATVGARQRDRRTERAEVVEASFTLEAVRFDLRGDEEG